MGRVTHGSNPGPSTVLTAREKEVLALYLLYMAERGFPLTLSMARAFASLHSGTSDCFNKEARAGKHLWSNFHARYPELTLHTVDNLEHSRANSLTKEVVDSYFETLKCILEENDLVNAPFQTAVQL